MSGPTISPDGQHWWDGTKWVAMPRTRSHRKGYSIGGGTLALLIILAAIGFTSGPLRFDCTVQQNGVNMQVEYSGLLAGLKCNSATSNGFGLVSTHSGDLVCRYPIGLTQVTVWDTGLHLYGSQECSDLQTQYNQQQQQSSGSSP
jgi:hypothetical protein